MKIRSELNVLAADILSAASHWNGGEKIKVGQVETTIAQVSQSVLNKLNTYQTEEKSLKGRIETAQNVLNALNEVQGKSLNPDRETELISTVRKVRQIISSAIQTEKDLEGKISTGIQDYVNKRFITDTDPLRLELLHNAFRIIKTLDSNEQFFIDHSAYQLAGTLLFSFSNLKKDLIEFQASYHKILTESQHAQINALLPRLDIASEINAKFVHLFLLNFEEGAPDDVIESKIANYAYEIEQLIEELEVHEAIILPGGCSGHAVVFEIQRVRENEYHFSIFNTGLGNEFGQIADQGGVNQFRVPVFTKLSKEAVVDQKFIMDLIRFKVKSTHGMNPVHQAIVEHFVNKNGGMQTVREPHDNQSWGTCSFDSVAAYLEYKLASSYLSLPFQYDLMLRARMRLNSLLSSDETKKNFYQKTLDFIDKKSCETFSKWRDYFLTYCDVEDQFNDLMIAKHYIGMHAITSEEELKNSFQGTLDGAFAAVANNEHVPFYIKYMTLIDKMLKKVSPKQWQILEDRYQTMVPQQSSWLSWKAVKNAAILRDINFSAVLNYLKERFTEIALCDYPLIHYPGVWNPHFLQYRALEQAAMIGCKMLPPAATP